MSSGGQRVMEEYLRSYLRARRTARGSLVVLLLTYSMVLWGALDGWMPWYGLVLITCVYAVVPVVQRWDRTLPPWWAYWGGTIILLPVDTERKQEMREWIAANNLPWYHPEDFVHHFQHKRHAVLAKLMWGGR